MRIFLSFFFSMAAFSAFGQKPGAQLSLKIGAKYQPTNFLLMREVSTSLDKREQFNFWPILQADLGLRKNFERSSWFWESALSYRHTRQILKNDFFNPPQGDTDPAIPQGEVRAIDLINQFGLKAGMGHQWRTRNRKNAFVLTMGAEGYVSLFSKNIFGTKSKTTQHPLYEGDDFYEGLYYGLYLSPAYQFGFSRSSAWRFSVFADTDLLIHNGSKANPVFLWGGGLGAAYQL